MDFTKLNLWWVVGAIVALTIGVGIFFGIRNKNNPEDVSFEFLQEYIWKDYENFTWFANEKNANSFDVLEIDGTLNGSIDSLSLDNLNVLVLEEFYLLKDSVYVLRRDFTNQTIDITAVSSYENTSNINSFATGNYLPLYDAVRAVKWSHKVKTPNTRNFSVKRGDDGRIYYFFDNVRVSNDDKKVFCD